MRIAFLNVWSSTTAEAQGGEALKRAGKAIGAEVIPCFNSADIEACQPDYVLVNSRTQAKLTRFPTYAYLNEPSTVYFRDPKLLQYMFSFDGYASISESLVQFLNQALYGIGRHENVAACFNTSQRMECDSAPVRDALFSGTATLLYFGTNWDGRRIEFFRAFGRWDKGEIYGPKTSWQHYNLPSYKGSVPFDGIAAQTIYLHKGMGLNLLADHHLEEDVISNRIFEIASVGAVVLSCRMPWIEKHFGDSVYYFDQTASNKRMMEEIIQLHAHILKHPDEAWEKAQRARKIFEEKFALEVLLQNTIDLHNEKQASIAKKPRNQSPLVSVVITSDGTQPQLLHRAITSIAQQDSGQYHVVLVKTKPFDFTFTAPHVTMDIINGTCLWDGLRHVKGDYVAILRDTDEWFPQHIRRLLEMSEAGHFVHCAVVTEHPHVAPDTAWIKNNEHRGVTHQLDLKDHDYMTAVELIHPSGYLIPHHLVDDRLLQCPPPIHAQDKALIMDMLARAKPKQNFATTVFVRADEQRAAPALSPLETTHLMLRHWRSNPHTGAKNTLWDDMVATGHRARAFRYETVRSITDGVIVDALKQCRFDRTRLKQIPIPRIRERCFFHMGMTLEDDTHFSATIAATAQMHGVAGFIAFPQQQDEHFPNEYLVVIEAVIEAGQIGIHLIQNQNTLERYSVARSFDAPHHYRLELPIYYRPEINGIAINITPNTKGRIKSITAYVEE